MAKRLKGEEVLRVKVKEELANRVGPAHRADFEILAKMKEILVIYRGGDIVHLLRPQGALSSLRKGCVDVLGPAPIPTA